MTKRNERAEDVKAAGAGEEPAREPWRPRTRVILEAVVAAIPEEPRGKPTRVVAEAVVAAIPEPGPAEGADAEAGAGA